MKKLLTLALALLMALGALVACSGDELNFGAEYVAAEAQIDVLTQLNAKSVDVGVMDSVMANYYMSQDSKYADKLQIVESLVLAEEEYGIAARKGSGLIKKINGALVELAKSGELDTLATKYGLKDGLLVDPNTTVAELTEAEKKDWDYIVGKGEVVVGYTLFAPIAYMDGDTLVGFDIELAKAVFAKLDIDVKFYEINWDNKEAEMESKSIDCLWNGMTITEERQAMWEVSVPYLKNAQVAVIRKEDADIYKTTADMDDAIVSAEGGSAGEGCILPEED